MKMQLLFSPWMSLQITDLQKGSFQKSIFSRQAQYMPVYKYIHTEIDTPPTYDDVFLTMCLSIPLVLDFFQVFFDKLLLSEDSQTLLIYVCFSRIDKSGILGCTHLQLECKRVPALWVVAHVPVFLSVR